MKQFDSTSVVPISPQDPSLVESTLRISGIDQPIDNLHVSVDINHTYTSDLTIVLLAPSGRGVTLFDRRGGSGDNIKGATFDDSASLPIAYGAPPFDGLYRPEGSLGSLAGENANGVWTLRVMDSAYWDGGQLNGWSLSVAEAAPRTSNYRIEVDFAGGLSASQMAVFDAAARRWSEVIRNDLTLVIEARGVAIDGPGSVLGQAGPTSVKPGTLFPDTGLMEFDSSDLASMEAQGDLFNVILHEMGHVLGIGTLWQHLDLVEGAGTADPLFVGANAMREYGVLLNRGPAKVPVANTGGPGTADGHWREIVFGDELMSGYADPGQLPLSRMSIGMLEDMNYQVNYDAADPYVLPSRRIAMASLSAKARKRKLKVLRPPCEGLPELPRQ